MGRKVRGPADRTGAPMKSVTLAALLSIACLSALRPSSNVAPSVCHDHHGALPLLRDDPLPPPIDCPMCGGNVVVHQRRTRFFVRLQANLFLWNFVSTRSPL